jgi:hypothetical protein
MILAEGEVDDLVQNVLKHYVSDNYDPVKARAYYLKTRDLKGRRKKRLKTESQRDIWRVAKDSIKTDKKADVDKARDNKKDRNESFRADATVRRDKIRGKLKLVIEKLMAQQRSDKKEISEERKDKSLLLTDKAKQERAKISRTTKSKIAALPENLSKEDRARLVSRIRGNAKTERVGVSEKTKSDRASLSEEAKEAKVGVSTKDERDGKRDTARGSREKVSEDLKASIEDSRQLYNTKKAELKEKYNIIKDNEYESIRTGA